LGCFLFLRSRPKWRDLSTALPTSQDATLGAGEMGVDGGFGASGAGSDWSCKSYVGVPGVHRTRE